MALLIVTISNNASGGGSGNINGNRAITLNVPGFVGVNPGQTNIKDWLETLFYPSQVPISALTITYNGNTSGALQVEKMAAGADLNLLLNWSVTRQAATEAIASIVAGGVNQVYIAPGPGSSVSGTQAKTIVRNANTTFHNIATTADAKTADAAATISFLDYLYHGFSAVNNPDDATIQALAKFFTTTRTHGAINDNAPGSLQYFVIAFPEFLDAGNVSQIWVGGLDQTGTFTRTVRAFTNASGYTSNYIFYILTDPTAGSISFEIL